MRWKTSELWWRDIMATYCGVCYTSKQSNPYGYCNECWLKAGKPTKENPQGSIDKR